MATAQPHPSSRRSRDPPRDDVTVGNFRRLEEIGKGSFATVYKAVHVQKGAFVAIKSVQLQKLNKKLKENLYSEIHILKGLHHPHIVALIDCQESVHHIHLVMEFCQLGDLSYFIKKREKLAGHAATAEMVRKYPNPPGGGLNEVVVRHFLKQLASALEFLRAKNFIHRDVKPQNLLLNPSPLFFAKAQPEMMPLAASENSLVPVVGVESLPMLKIADFGFARSLPSTSLAETLCGSPLYMAPEILRYEKYDAKADLWSVGTVLYEMVVGKPPFRASNHVELLRKIERGEDRIKFPEEVILSDNMKKLIRGLLKRSPVERMGFMEFFDDTVVKDEIPGLVGDDVKPSETPRPESKKPQVLQDEKVTGLRQQSTPTSHTRQPQNEGSRQSESPPERFYTAPQTRAESSPMVRQRSDATGRLSSEARRYSGQALRPPSSGQRNSPDPSRRPGMISHATAPARQEQSERPPVAAAVAMERQTSGTSASPGSSFLKEQGRTREQQPIRRDNYTTREAREKADQEVAFERDYVVVEKRAVEVNAFADELAASPRLHGAYHDQGSQQQGAMIRRATVSGGGNGPAGIQASPSRAMQIATGRHRSDNMGHQPKSSYERRYGASPTSATSAISKALNMANFRLFGMGFSPPLGGKSQSPPQLYGYPAYPTPQGHLITTDGKTTIPLGEDSKAIHVIEELATRSDVVYGFAEVKYKQLIPLAPSAEHGLGLHQAGVEGGEAVDDDEGLTIDATVTLSEEALVLYVKALSLLAKSMDTAGAWWARKNRGEVVDHSTPRTDSNTPTGVAVGARINNVVQWVRTRFNEVLEKAEFVRRKLIESQNRLPLDHPSHPRNRSAASTSTMEMGTSTEGVFVSPGVTAERLMYDRAVEMSRAAAVNELVGEDLAGCEIAYITAQRMLEAVLENDEELNPSRKGSLTGKEGVKADKEPINGLEAEDREVVEKMVVGIRGRLAALRKKIAMLKRSSLQQPPAPVRTPSTTATTGTPAVATTPPQ